MKNFLITILMMLSFSAIAQTDPIERDSCANTVDFQTKVKIASLSAANDLLADTAQADYTIKYAQLIVTNPQGGWVVSMSYGVMSNPAINCGSSQSDIQFTVNSIFVKYAAAYYQIPPSQQAEEAGRRRLFNRRGN